MSVIVAGSLMMVWAEWAGRRPWRRVKLPAQLRFWIVVGCVALSLPAFVMFKPIADLLMLSPLAPSDWLLALMVAILAVCWRAPGSSSARGKDGPG